MNIQAEAKKIMKMKDFTQADLAKEVGIHPVTLCLLLKDPKRPDTAYDKLARYLRLEAKRIGNQACASKREKGMKTEGEAHAQA